MCTHIRYSKECAMRMQTLIACESMQATSLSRIVPGLYVTHMLPGLPMLYPCNSAATTKQADSGLAGKP